MLHRDYCKYPDRLSRTPHADEQNVPDDRSQTLYYPRWNLRNEIKSERDKLRSTPTSPTNALAPLPLPAIALGRPALATLVKTITPRDAALLQICYEECLQQGDKVRRNLLADFTDSNDKMGAIPALVDNIEASFQRTGQTAQVLKLAKVLLQDSDVILALKLSNGGASEQAILDAIRLMPLGEITHQAAEVASHIDEPVIAELNSNQYFSRHQRAHTISYADRLESFANRPQRAATFIKRFGLAGKEVIDILKTTHPVLVEHDAYGLRSWQIINFYHPDKESHEEACVAYAIPKKYWDNVFPKPSLASEFVNVVEQVGLALHCFDPSPGQIADLVKVSIHFSKDLRAAVTVALSGYMAQ